MWYIGMDVGGTHIDCVALGTGGERSEAHHIRPTSAPPEEVAPKVVLEFLKDLGITRKNVKAVALGWKHGRNKERSLAMVNAFAKAELSAHVYWDAETAFAGALPEKIGVIALSGTGSVVYGRTQNGKIISSGGWSPLLGDPGSSFAIGQQALVAALRDRDGTGHKTELTVTIPQALSATLDELVVMADAQMAQAVPKIAGLAPTVFQLADTGDVEAVRIREEAAEQLSERLASALRIWPGGGTIPVSFAGRLMLAQAPFRMSIQKHLADEGINIQWREPQFRPPYGAILSVYPALLSTLTAADQSMDWHHA